MCCSISCLRATWAVGVGRYARATAGDERLARRNGLPSGYRIHRAQRQADVGLFDQNLFTFAGRGARGREPEHLQPSSIIHCAQVVRRHSEMNLVYDWERDEWTALPLG